MPLTMLYKFLALATAAAAASLSSPVCYLL